jgi:hypothetical protein
LGAIEVVVVARVAVVVAVSGDEEATCQDAVRTMRKTKEILIVIQEVIKRMISF